jgi:hypothetical protein
MPGRSRLCQQRRKIKLPEYIPIAEVQRVCAELHIRDWTQL